MKKKAQQQDKKQDKKLGFEVEKAPLKEIPPDKLRDVPAGGVMIAVRVKF
jgi:hypothetical protein